MPPPIMPPPLRNLSRKAAIVGIGETDYGADYQAARRRAPGYEAPSVESLSLPAFERALADSGLSRADIDGLSVSFTFGGPSASEMAGLLGIEADFAITNGNIMAGPLPVVCAAIAEGKATTVAMIFSVASRSIGKQFGGASDAMAVGMPSSYYYFHPWGWSSQAAHWALMFSHYQATYNTREEDLGAVAVQIRRHAIATPGAVMQAPITIADYMASRYIVRPLHLFDICLVNDGAVCLIVTTPERARDLPHVPVAIAGWGEAKTRGNKLDAMVRQRLRPQMQEAGGQALGMAGLALADIQLFEGYDASTIHLINQVEGFGFVDPGAGVEFCKDGGMAIGGRLPTNTGGGNLSGSYMQGWSQVANVVRQLRHEAGAQQVNAAQTAMTSLVQTDRAHPLVFVRGEN